MKYGSMISALLLAGPALAHPGHAEAAMATHWLSDAAHLAVFVATTALVALVVGVLRRKLAQGRARQ